MTPDLVTLKLDDGQDIRPMIVGGEPVCSGNSCNAYFRPMQARFGYSSKGACRYVTFAHVFPARIDFRHPARNVAQHGDVIVEVHPCIPAIRAQREAAILRAKKTENERDEARRLVCVLAAILPGTEDPDLCSVQETAEDRGWSYLYSDGKTH